MALQSQSQGVEGGIDLAALMASFLSEPIPFSSPCSAQPPTAEEGAAGCYLALLSSGFPNVGKSSLINGLVGRKVVSVSRTPGHTRYFQTYFLTPSVKLCDCPGLIFPSLLPRQLQVCGKRGRREAGDPGQY